MDRYKKIKRLGHEDNEDIFTNDEDVIFIEEKADGQNTRIGIINNNLLFGSRNLDLQEGTTNCKSFQRSIDFIREKLNKVDLSKYDGLMLVVENMVKHTLNYDWDRTPPLLGFDIFDIKNTRYLDYDDKVRIFKELDIPIVSLVGKFTAKELKMKSVDELMALIPQAEYGDFLAEGIVFKNQSNKIYAKLVRDEFKEQNKTNFGTVKKEATDDTERVVAEFVTNARIDKAIFKKIYEGNKLQMNLMGFVPNMVVDDLMAEELQTIIKRKYTIDFRKLQKKVSKRCLAVLQTMITNQALETAVKTIADVKDKNENIQNTS